MRAESSQTMTELLSIQASAIPNEAVGELTFREWEILLLIASDKPNAEIEVITKLKSRSVINIRNRIGDKLGLKGRNHLGQFARKHRALLEHWFIIFYPPR